MGCMPSTNKVKATYKSDITSHIIPVQNKPKELKITEGMLVQEVEGDPYLFYEETKLLGEGSFGKVFKVRHRISNVTRAMKIINKEKAAIGSEEEQALINEINILKCLDHPNIIKVYEFFNTQKKLYIISELCTGGELFDKISVVKTFTERICAHIMRQLFSAVQFCHTNGIIHRDLKPENILIESQEEASKELFTIKVIDFGTSDKFGRGKMHNKQIGTPFYIAPEVLNNSYNEKCDLWSCGVIIYILLCGLPPFWAENENEIYAAVKRGKYTMEGDDWEDISEDAKDLIRNLLTKDINKRFSAQEALNHRWFKNLKEELRPRPVPIEFISKVAKNLKFFRATHKLQQATLAYIVHNLTRKEECEDLRRVFMEWDENGDGRLTKEEIIAGLVKVMPMNEATDEVNKVMEIVDVDGNGYIEYEEFLRASMNKDKLLTDDNLRIVFKMFDKESSGKITSGNLKAVLGKEEDIDDKIWKNIVSDIDENGDGEISFSEFKLMMTKVINKDN